MPTNPQQNTPNNVPLCEGGVRGIFPSLRFPGFSDGWEEKRLGKIAEFLKGKGITKIDVVEDGNLECIRYGELYTKYGETINSVYSKTNLNPKNLILSKANDVIIPASGETQIDIAKASCVLNSSIALGGDLNIIRSKNNGVFLSYYLNSKKKFDIARLSQGISVVHLYSSQLKTLKLNLPFLPEQEKIAGFLTTVDEKIEKIREKKKALQEYKKGLMQKIFSVPLSSSSEAKDLKEGKDYFRFPRFSGAWEEKKLGDICKLQGGYAFQSAEFKKSGIPIIRISNISNNNNYIDLSNLVFYDKIDNDYNFTIKKGDLLIAMSGATTGKSSIYNLENSAYLNQRVGLFNANKNKLNYQFLIQFVFSNLFLRQLDAVLVAGAQPNISGKDIEKFKINIPALPEQEKIANFLSAIDEKIEKIDSELVEVESWKKGLLQGLFV